jgi:hypothetical protein
VVNQLFSGPDPSTLTQTHFFLKKSCNPVLHLHHAAAHASPLHANKHEQMGIFNGTVAIVPSLKAPGFCNAEARAGLGEPKFPDVSTYYKGVFARSPFRCSIPRLSYVCGRHLFSFAFFTPLFCFRSRFSRLFFCSPMPTLALCRLQMTLFALLACVCVQVALSTRSRARVR